MIKLARERAATVADIMTKELVILDSRTSLDVAARILSERRIGGAPIVSPEGEPLGMVTRADLLDPRHASTDASVESAMTRLLYAVRPTDPALAAIRLMAAENIHRVVVVDPQGKLVGIVTSMDVVRALAHGDASEGAVALEFVKLHA
jgi:CBS domain-containing protein